MHFRPLCPSVLLLLALVVSFTARATTPVCAPEGPPAAVPAALFRALSTDRGLESAGELRRELRALWVGRQAVSGPVWDADCEEANRDSGAVPGLIRHALADGSWLIQVACAQGAYQGSFWAAQLWAPQAAPGRPKPTEIPPGGATPQASRGSADDEPAAASVLCWPVPSEPAGGMPVIDLTGQVVVWGDLDTVGPAQRSQVSAEIVNRFRAIGDCGTRSRYVLERGATRLVELAAAWACPETPAAVPVGPAEWPRAILPDR